MKRRRKGHQKSSGQSLIDVAMIVKNEEAHIADCLRSVKALRPLLGRICVYDTGSTDRTVELARAEGAIVREGYWDDDFSRARNESLAMTSAIWVLWIDADERLVVDIERLAVVLRMTAQAPRLEAGWLINKMADDPGGAVQARALRILRNKAATFVGRVHERPMRVEDGCPLQPFTLPERIIHLVHHGYTSETIEGKLHRNLALAENYVERLRAGQPTDEELSTALLDRGRTHAGLGRRAEAEADLEEVLTLQAHSAVRAEAACRLAEFQLMDDHPDEALGFLKAIETGAEENSHVRWLRGRALHAKQEFAEALEIIRSVDRPTTPQGYMAPWREVLLLRMELAARQGHTEEALSAGLALATRHGGAHVVAGLMIALWGKKEASQLAVLLAQASQDYDADVEAAFANHSESGRLVAQEYRSHWGRPANATPTGRTT
ncbi:tetratricopeptide repeat-containing glycosyltransferase family 2 protein [Austwickia chelonae]|uniref:tetratricopeptide repeat-containing glycosyltransferase family 2 protein n=1 Tax=Austwickia chelonae TaxID=100225 RepID=UPI000E235799|nr:glycosyltransferase family 2 protein [Austwickia chelonae]